MSNKLLISLWMLLTAACSEQGASGLDGLEEGSAGATTGGSVAAAGTGRGIDVETLETPAGSTGGALNAGGAGGAGGAAGEAAGATEAELCARYEVLDPGNTSDEYSYYYCPDPGSGCDGSGLVRDTTTGLEWLRFSYRPEPAFTHREAHRYCLDRGMRLPTREEAVEVSGSNFSTCAWPQHWVTWTSTLSTYVDPLGVDSMEAW